MTDKNERDALLKKAYSKATSELRKAHADEFGALYKAAGLAIGVQVTLKPTKAERAKAQINALLNANPELVDDLRIGLNAAAEPAE